MHFFPMAQQLPVDQGLLIVEASRSHSVRHSTLGKSPLDEGSARLRDLYLTTHITHKRQTSMPQAGFEPAIPVRKRLQTHTLDRAVTEIGNAFSDCKVYYYVYYNVVIHFFLGR
jgi:hypothetical protein